MHQRRESGGPDLVEVAEQGLLRPLPADREVLERALVPETGACRRRPKHDQHSTASHRISIASDLRHPELKL